MEGTLVAWEGCHDDIHVETQVEIHRMRCRAGLRDGPVGRGICQRRWWPWWRRWLSRRRWLPRRWWLPWRRRLSWWRLPHRRRAHRRRTLRWRSRVRRETSFCPAHKPFVREPFVCAAELPWRPFVQPAIVCAAQHTSLQHRPQRSRRDGHNRGGRRVRACGEERQRDAERQRRAALTERAPDQSGAEQHRRAARSAHPRVHHRKRGHGGVAWWQLVVVAPSQWRFWVGRPLVLAVRFL